MERQDYIDQINSLKETAEQFKEMNAVLKQAFASSEQCREQAQKQIEILQGVISNLSKEISLLRKEVSKQTDYNKRHNKISFGKKSLSSSAKQEIKKSREESKWIMMVPIKVQILHLIQIKESRKIRPIRMMFPLLTAQK